MKKMRKLLIIPILLIAFMCIVACSVTSIIKIEFTQTPNDIYYIDDQTGTGEVEATVVVHYSNGQVSNPTSIEGLKGLGLQVSGNSYTGPGDYTLKISYGSIVITYDYKVEIKSNDVIVSVSDQNELTNAISQSTDNTLIKIVADFTITTQIALTKSLRIIGNKGSGVKPIVTFKPDQVDSSSNFALFNVNSTVNPIKIISFENVIFMGKGSNIPNNDYFLYRKDTGLTTTINDILIKGCEFSNFSETICIKTDNGSTTTDKTQNIRNNNFSVINSTFTNNTFKTIYLEGSNNIFISNNTFNKCATSTKNIHQYAYPCVIDINLKYYTYNKAEVSDNTFNNSGVKMDNTAVEFDFEFKNQQNTFYGYAAVIAIKARNEANSYSGNNASILKQVIVSNNNFENNFPHYLTTNKDNTTTKSQGHGISLIMFGENSFTSDGILTSQVIIQNNSVDKNYIEGKTISLLNWYDQHLNTKSGANSKFSGCFK